MRISKATAAKIKEALKPKQDGPISDVGANVAFTGGNSPAIIKVTGMHEGQIALMNGSLEWEFQDGTVMIYNARDLDDLLVDGEFYLALLYEYDTDGNPIFMTVEGPFPEYVVITAENSSHSGLWEGRLTTLEDGVWVAGDYVSVVELNDGVLEETFRYSAVRVGNVWVVDAPQLGVIVQQSGDSPISPVEHFVFDGADFTVTDNLDGSVLIATVIPTPSITVQEINGNFPPTPDTIVSYTDVNTLRFNQDRYQAGYGIDQGPFTITNLGSGILKIDLLDAAGYQRGVINGFAQDFRGDKRLFGSLEIQDTNNSILVYGYNSYAAINDFSAGFRHTIDTSVSHEYTSLSLYTEAALGHYGNNSGYIRFFNRNSEFSLTGDYTDNKITFNGVTFDFTASLAITGQQRARIKTDMIEVRNLNVFGGSMASLPAASVANQFLGALSDGSCLQWRKLIAGSGITFTSGGTIYGEELTIAATGTGTLTAVSVATANGFAGSSSGGATPILTLSTTITGMLKGNGTAISAATAGTDYLAPAAIGTTVQAWDADLDTIAGLTATTDNFIVSVSSAWASRTPAQVRTTLGLGTAALVDTGTSGTKVALTDGANQWSASQRFINSSGIKILDTDASNTLGVIVGSDLSADRTLTIATGDANRTLTFTADATIGGTSSGTNTGDQTITLTGDVTGTGTGSFTTAIAAGVIVDADVNASAAIAWSKLDKTGSSLADLTTKSAADITSGTLAVARGGTNLGTTPTNGKLLIGNGTDYTLANLTNGTGIAITNGSGTITITNNQGYDLSNMATVVPALGDEVPFWDVSSSAQGKATVATMQALSTHSPGGRLTLLSGSTWDTTYTTTGTNTIYYKPHTSNYCVLYDGSKLVLADISSVSSLTPSLSANSTYDIWLYLSSGNATLDISAAWTSQFVRNQDIAANNGFWTKSGDATRRYIGTVHTNASNAIVWTPAYRGIYNVYNKLPCTLIKRDSTASWTYAGAAYRSANNDSANKVELVCGLPGDVVELRLDVMASATSLMSNWAYIALNSSTGSVPAVEVDATTNFKSPATCCYTGVPGIGYHSFNWLEYSTAAATATWYGYSSTNYESGLKGIMWM